MKPDVALEKAALAWCQPDTSDMVMSVRLGNAFAEILMREMKPLEDHLEIAWGVIANAGGGDWTKESPDWQYAATRWRDQYHFLLARHTMLKGRSS